MSAGGTLRSTIRSIGGMNRPMPVPTTISAGIKAAALKSFPRETMTAAVAAIPVAASSAPTAASPSPTRVINRGLRIDAGRRRRLRAA